MNFLVVGDIQCDSRNFSALQVNIGYFYWFPQDLDSMRFLRPMCYDVYGIRIRQSHRIVTPEGQNDSEYEQNGN